MRPAARNILEAMLRGEEISIMDSRRLKCGAIPQRVSELRALGIEVKDRFPTVNGERQAYKVYYLDAGSVLK
jgi:hypothetical protein